MTIETEDSKKVSDEQLLLDIELTHKESDAYSKLTEGFGILTDLPENKESGKSDFYKMEYYRYSSANNGCVKFLRQLYALKAERGL